MPIDFSESSNPIRQVANPKSNGNRVELGLGKGQVKGVCCHWHNTAGSLVYWQFSRAFQQHGQTKIRRDNPTGRALSNNLQRDIQGPGGQVQNPGVPGKTDPVN